MKIKLTAPYKSMHGQVQGLNPADPEMRFYFRTNKQTGVVWACKCPNQTKPPSAAQLANRARFTQIYAKVRRIERNEPQ